MAPEPLAGEKLAAARVTHLAGVRSLFLEHLTPEELDAAIAFVVGGAILVSLYGIAIGVEAMLVAGRGCRSCGSGNVELAS